MRGPSSYILRMRQAVEFKLETQKCVHQMNNIEMRIINSENLTKGDNNLSTIENVTSKGFNREALNYEAVSQRPIQRYTTELEIPLLKKHVKSDDLVLEIGCGHGRTTRILSNLTQNHIYAIDFSEEMINQAKKWNKKKNITYICDDATKIQSAEIKAQQFDIVAAFSCVNCIPDIDAAFENAAKLLKPDGKILVEAFNKYEAARAWRWLYLLPSSVMKLLRIWPDDWYTRYLSYQELESIGEKQGLTIVEYQGLRFFADWIPSIPFNKFKIFSPFTYFIIKRLQWLDNIIMKNKMFSKYCRFHWMVFEKKK